jgi:hypothetical protein
MSRSQCQSVEVDKPIQPPTWKFVSMVPVRPAFFADEGAIKESTSYRMRQPKYRFVDMQLERPSSEAPELIGRQVQSYVDMPKKPEIRLAKETIAELLQDEIVDPNDFAWLNERKRRLDAGEGEDQLLRFPPLGRQQRKIKQSRSITTAVRESKAELKTSLDTIEQDIKDGRAETQGGFMRVITDIAALAQVGRLSATKILKLEQLITALNLPDYKQSGLPAAVDQKVYNAEEGTILIYLLKPPRRNFNPSLTPELLTRAGIPTPRRQTLDKKKNTIVWDLTGSTGMGPAPDIGKRMLDFVMQSNPDHVLIPEYRIVITRNQLAALRSEGFPI